MLGFEVVLAQVDISNSRRSREIGTVVDADLLERRSQTGELLPRPAAYVDNACRRPCDGDVARTLVHVGLVYEPAQALPLGTVVEIRHLGAGDISRWQE